MRRLLIILCSTVIFPVALFSQNKKIEVSLGYSHMFFKHFLDQYDLTETDPAPSHYPNVGSGKASQLNGLTVAGRYQVTKQFFALFEIGGYTGNYHGDMPVTVFIKGSPTQPTYLIFIAENPDNMKQKFYSFTGGIEYRNTEAKKRLNPFAHVLLGAGIENIKWQGLQFPSSKINFDSIYHKTNFTSTGFNMIIGGGIDFLLNKYFDLQILQIDYNALFMPKKNVLSPGDIRTPIPSDPQNRNLSSVMDIYLRKNFQNNFRVGMGIIYKLPVRKMH